MPPLFDLKIAALDRSTYEGRTQSLVACGSEGSFGVLARHAPMVAELAPGELQVVEETGQRRSFAVSGGVLEVTWGGVVILADAAEAAEEIDVARARAARGRAEQRLHNRQGDIDAARAEAALRRALTRLRVAEKRRQGQ